VNGSFVLEGLELVEENMSKIWGCDAEAVDLAVDLRGVTSGRHNIFHQ
jgi:hypothetical protein